MIFAENAPRYWAAGLPVMPLQENDKRPVLPGWQVFSDRMPTAEEQAVWLEAYGRGNVGLPLGAASGLVALDIDTDDPKVLNALEQVLPRSPWTRIGKKGRVWVFRYTGERTFRLRGRDDNTICELLSKGTQIVLPPSIHPDTKLPYHANVDLVDILSVVPQLPHGVEALIRGALRDQGFEVGSAQAKVSTFVPAGARDNAMVSMAGILARGVIRGERSLLEALAEIKVWVENFVEKVVGDDVSVEKAQQKLVEFLIRDVTGERPRALPVGWDAGLSEEDKKKLGLKFTDDDELWAADKIIEYLASEFERHVDANSVGWMQAIDVALSRIARHPHDAKSKEMNAMQEDRILRFIAGQTAHTPLTTLRKRLQELRRGDIKGDSHKDLAVEVLKEISRFGEARYDAGKFWQWRGASWEPVDQVDIMKTIILEFGEYPGAKKASDHKGILNTVAGLCSKSLSQIDIRGLNFANGFLTEDLKLIPHNPDHGMTYVLPYRYLPEEAGRMPLFNEFLTRCWGQDPDFGDKVMALQEAMGATLFGIAPRYQRAFAMIGKAHTGKTRIIELMRKLLPAGSTSAVPPHEWGDKFLPAQLFGKVMNTCGELSESKHIPGDQFKLIVEGNVIEAQHKNQQPFRFRPLCAHWFAGNVLPKSRDTTSGFNRRWLFLEFNHVLSAENKIENYEEVILAQETEAIVAWAVLGVARLKENRDYTLPSSCLALIDEMASDNNSVRYFLASSPRLRVGRKMHEGLSEISTTATQLHAEYWSFCVSTGTVQRAGLKRFQQMMKELVTDFDFVCTHRIGANQSVEPMFEFVTVVGGKK